MANTQPAKVSYFFGKGYADLGNTIKESWSRNLHSAGEQFTIAREKGCFTIGGGMNLIAAISIFTFGSVITAFTTFAHIAILLLFFALIYVGFSLLWLIDRIYIMVNKSRTLVRTPIVKPRSLFRFMNVPDVAKSTRSWFLVNMVS